MLINATINGVGQRQSHTKTRAGVRRLTLPVAVADMLRTRHAAAKPDSQLVCPATRRRNTGRIETPYWTSNITGQISTELDRLGHTGISGRSFRKMVATELDKHGYTPRQIADQLGHARPSVTLDIYQTPRKHRSRRGRGNPVNSEMRGEHLSVAYVRSRTGTSRFT